MKFFEINKNTLQFEWNSATPYDWPKIKRLFVSAYVGAYKNCDINDLALNEDLLRQAKRDNVDPLNLYFEHEYEAEIAKIKNQFMPGIYRINYLTTKYHDQPIAFIVSQLNYKSGRVYIRWNTVSPGFQHEGLGKLLLDAVANYYNNAKLELYTRKVNDSTRKFYSHCGLHESNKFSFDEPALSTSATTKQSIANLAKNWLTRGDFKETIFPPLDEKVDDLNAFVGYCRP